MGDAAYVVESGRLEVLKDGVKVDELAEGDCFGELALLSGVKRTASVRCLTACELTVLARDDFQALSSGQGALRPSDLQAGGGTRTSQINGINAPNVTVTM